MYFEDTLDNPWIAVFFLIFIGLIMLIADFIFKGKKDIKDLKNSNTFLIGIFQSMALIRGFSRSGISIIGGQVNGLSRKEATDFAFLIGIPSISIAFLYQIVQLIADYNIEEPFHYLIIGFIVSFISGYFAIKLMINIITKIGLKYFGLYRIVLGILTIIILL
jgi:undecaprenyl-diphosphatase